MSNQSAINAHAEAAKAVCDRATRERRDLTEQELRQVESHTSRIRELKAQDKAAAGKWDEVPDDLKQRVADSKAFADRIDGMTATATAGASPDLYASVKAAGWPDKSKVVVDNPALSKGVTVDGAVEDLNPARFTPAGLGFDMRFLHQALPSRRVESSETAVTSYRQSDRVLADPALMVRDIGETATKPETDTSVEVVQEPLRQIASISSSIPNIVWNNAREFIGNDLRLAYSQAVDGHVLDEIAGTLPATATLGDNLFESLMHAAEAVRSEGYAPRLAALSTTDALALSLEKLQGGDSYIATPQLGLRVVPVAGLSSGAGYVLDPQAAGILFLSPMSFSVHEENSGATNTSTARLESHGLFLIQRPSAISAVGFAGGGG